MTLPLPAVKRSGALMRYLLFLCIGLGIAAVFLLASASANTRLFSEYYTVLLGGNIVISVLLALMLVQQMFSLRRRLRSGIFGAKLTVRLVLLFALMAIIPGAVIYAVSVQFVSRSIESWFEVRLDRALESGISLGRNTLEGRLKELTARAQSMATALASRAPEERIGALSVLREQAGIEEATLYSDRGRLLAFSGSEARSVLPDTLNAQVLRQIRARQSYSAIESTPDRGLFLRTMVPLLVTSLQDDGGMLQLLEAVPKQLALEAEIIQSGYREYQELQLSRRGLKRLYAITLTLTLMLALFSALGIAFVLSDRLSAPLSVLVEGTRAVAQGDFSHRPAVSSRDELGQLTQSFNNMTLQLAEAQARVERNQAQLAHAKSYLESILAYLSAGVLTFDNRLKLRSANPSAAQILGVDSTTLLGRAVDEWPYDDPSLRTLALELIGAVGAGTGEWERQVEREQKNRVQMLLLRGTRFGEADDSGWIVVFDDVTHLLQAQRNAAWAEVARRLAHEIKNPLTPIQLSAERLQHKLSTKLTPADADILGRSTQTIVNQVTALKRMVDAFSQYARTPEPALRDLDLHALLREVLSLYESSGITIRAMLDPATPVVSADTGQMRQVLHNLMQNAQDALQYSSAPQVEVTTRMGEGHVELSFSDNGCGFPEQLMQHAFEPYVTTKTRGTGLGLSIVRKIVEEHQGTVSIANNPEGGARVSIRLPLLANPEQARTAA
jgi:PAS domain S-box-containing protein